MNIPDNVYISSIKWWIVLQASDLLWNLCKFVQKIRPWVISEWTDSPTRMILKPFFYSSSETIRDIMKNNQVWKLNFVNKSCRRGLVNTEGRTDEQTFNIRGFFRKCFEILHFPLEFLMFKVRSTLYEMNG